MLVKGFREEQILNNLQLFLFNLSEKDDHDFFQGFIKLQFVVFNLMFKLLSEDEISEVSVMCVY